MTWLIPPAIRRGDRITLQRALLGVRFALFIGPFAATFTPVLYMVGAPVPALYNVASSALIIASPLVLRATGSLKVGGHAVVVSIFAMLGGGSLLMGGINAPTTPVLALAPMAAAFLMERRDGLVWTGIIVAFTLALYGAHALGYDPPQYLPADSVSLIRSAAYVALLLCSLIFITGYDSTKQRIFAILDAANTRMTKMIGHVEATSAALSRSAAEFLGSESPRAAALPRVADLPREPGLTQQMMSTASSGREMIDGVGQSIHGMIGHYKRISERVHELYQQSGTIAEMVRTIDNISSRLDLMALNTGIEAAHAGESGRRFKLLADDMRRLAERVSAETRQIKSAIHRVQQHTDAAIQASMAGQALTDEGAAKLESMSRAFDEMYQLIERTAEASKRITQDTETQIEAIHRLANVSLEAQQTALLE